MLWFWTLLVNRARTYAWTHSQIHIHTYVHQSVHMCMCTHRPILESQITPILPIPIHSLRILSYLSSFHRHYYISSVVRTLVPNKSTHLLICSVLTHLKLLHNCSTLILKKPKSNRVDWVCCFLCTQPISLVSQINSLFHPTLGCLILLKVEKCWILVYFQFKYSPSILVKLIFFKSMQNINMFLKVNLYKRSVTSFYPIPSCPNFIFWFSCFLSQR